jgi:hypothetical protein
MAKLIGSFSIEKRAVKSSIGQRDRLSEVPEMGQGHERLPGIHRTVR